MCPLLVIGVPEQFLWAGGGAPERRADWWRVPTF
jgi:hypothetical protein